MPHYWGEVIRMQSKGFNDLIFDALLVRMGQSMWEKHDSKFLLFCFWGFICNFI